jgi:hypothetical protein
MTTLSTEALENLYHRLCRNGDLIALFDNGHFDIGTLRTLCSEALDARRNDAPTATELDRNYGFTEGAPEPRKIIKIINRQMDGTDGMVYALCNDGTVWKLVGTRWKQEPSIKQDEVLPSFASAI